MSGPLKLDDVETSSSPVETADVDVDFIQGREVSLGGRRILRTLPRRARRTVGPWCFLDQMTPDNALAENPMAIGPHPHMGLQTVTWLTAGEVLHRDSLGVEQTISPGQLNLMSSGRGVAHAEQALPGSSHTEGVQLWVAQPEKTRFSEPAFEHHADLPSVDIDNATASVMVGAFAGAISSARRDTNHVGVQISARHGQTVLPLDPAYEHALLALDLPFRINGQATAPGTLAYLRPGHAEITLDCDEPLRILLIGGEPFDEPLLMWWNFVARTRDEVESAAADWNAHSDKFGSVATELERIEAPIPPSTRSVRPTQ